MIRGALFYIPEPRKQHPERCPALSASAASCSVVTPSGHALQAPVAPSPRKLKRRCRRRRWASGGLRCGSLCHGIRLPFQPPESPVGLLESRPQKRSDEIPGLRPRLAVPLCGRNGDRLVPEQHLPLGGRSHLAVANAPLRSLALHPGPVQPRLHPPRPQPGQAAGIVASHSAAGTHCQVGGTVAARRRNAKAGLFS